MDMLQSFLGSDDDVKKTAEAASQHAGDSGDADLFGSVLGQLQGKQHQIAQGDVDEESAVQHHKKFFGSDDDDGSEATDSSMGSAAAMQALKMFSGGGGGGGQGQFVALAMSEASKLFDQQSSQGRVSSNSSKESAVTSAGEMALKMYMKSQGSSGMGPGGLLGLASKFM